MRQKFLAALAEKKACGSIPVIPDIKCRSPKEGDLLRGRDPLLCAQILAEAGAPALSVVTETNAFGGSLQLLKSVAVTTNLPVLRKDFISSSDDLRLTKDCGAAAVLLICAIQPKRQLTTLYEEALRLGLEPLVETRTKEELLFAGDIGAQLVGINNRNILALEKDDGTIEATAQLAKYKPKNSFLISESAINLPADARAAVRAGADALLIGTAIWQGRDIREAYLQFSQEIKDDSR